MDGESIPLRPLSGNEPSQAAEDEDLPTPRGEQQSFLDGRTVRDQVRSQGDDSVIKKGDASDSGPTALLHRSSYALLLASLYAALAIFTWASTCILSFRPLSTNSYGFNVNSYSKLTYLQIHRLYVTNDRVYEAIRIFQGIVDILTIPVTSAVCAKAAVIFTQHSTAKSALTLRQTMVLADNSWTDPEVVSKLFLKGSKRYLSSFLVFAILLHVLGGILSPLRGYFVGQETIGTPTGPQDIFDMCSISDHFPQIDGGLYDNSVTVLARAAMASTSLTDQQSRLWQGNSSSCNLLNETDLPLGSVCDSGGATFNNFSLLGDPFLAQLPFGYNTGLVKQYLPRINSTATMKTITDSSTYPQNCGTGSNQFRVSYSGASSDRESYYAFEACMPADLSQSPWRNTVKRQDFSEILYLNITTFGTLNSDVQHDLYEVTMDTTAGFFELPNYTNKTSGPLLIDGPPYYCGDDCVTEDGSIQGGTGKQTAGSTGRVRRQATTNSSDLLALESIPNKGPLLTIAMALFGEASFIANRVFLPEYYLASKFDNYSASPYFSRVDPWHCQEMVPFARLIGTWTDTDSPGLDNELFECSRNNIESTDDLVGIIVEYLQLFQYGNERVQNAFNAAAFLANEAWLLNPPPSPGTCTLQLSYDPGANAQKPAIKSPGVPVISTLLGIYLLGLFAVAFYSALTPSWTTQLDAFAMMRIGAAISEEVPLKVVDDTKNVHILDRTPGYFGDASGGVGNVGELGLGVHTPLARRRKYRSYDVGN